MSAGATNSNCYTARSGARRSTQWRHATAWDSAGRWLLDSDSRSRWRRRGPNDLALDCRASGGRAGAGAVNGGTGHRHTSRSHSLTHTCCGLCWLGPKGGRWASSGGGWLCSTLAHDSRGSSHSTLASHSTLSSHSDCWLSQGGTFGCGRHPWLDGRQRRCSRWTLRGARSTCGAGRGRDHWCDLGPRTRLQHHYRSLGHSRLGGRRGGGSSNRGGCSRTCRSPRLPLHHGGRRARHVSTLHGNSTWPGGHRQCRGTDRGSCLGSSTSGSSPRPNGGGGSGRWDGSLPGLGRRRLVVTAVSVAVPGPPLALPSGLSTVLQPLALLPLALRPLCLRYQPGPLILIHNQVTDGGQGGGECSAR
jgi:hypothetical protein